MSKFIKSILFLSSLIFVLPAFSYAPNLDMILSRVARNHGYGHYLVEQAVLLRSETEQVKLTEYWVIKDSKSMYLKITNIKGSDQPFNLFYVYKDRSRFALTTRRRTRKPLPKEWMGKILTFRDKNVIKPYLYSLKLIPSAGLNTSKKSL